MTRGGRGGEDNAPPGRFCCRGFPARDICPNRYNNSQKTHSKFTNCKALLCDYFPLNIQCTYRRASPARRDVFIEPLLSVTYHLFRFELVPPTSVVLNRSKYTIVSQYYKWRKILSFQCYCYFLCKIITKVSNVFN